MNTVIIYKSKDDTEFFKNEISEQGIEFIDLQDPELSNWLCSINRTPFVNSANSYHLLRSLDTCFKKHKNIFISFDLWTFLKETIEPVYFSATHPRLFLFGSRTYSFTEADIDAILRLFDTLILTHFVYKVGKPLSPLVCELKR